MFERLNEKQFNYLMEAMCLYKSLNPGKVVTLSEKSAKAAMNFFNREGKQFGPMLNAIAESGLTMDQLLEKAQEEQDKADAEEEVDEEEVDEEAEVDEEEVDDVEVDDVEVDDD
jgi:hypothetical protein